jgi:hypothetical protein
MEKRTRKSMCREEKVRVTRTRRESKTKTARWVGGGHCLPVRRARSKRRVRSEVRWEVRMVEE